jgi:hypothetical protein
MYQTINSAEPEAYITRKKSRAKIYHFNNLYLNDGELFEIELFNPKENRVLAKIWLNGEEISGSGIIVKPGQRIFLERFIDSNNKFTYKTYDVEDTSLSINAIRNNGDIEVKFYNEYFNNFNNNYWYSSPLIGGTATGTYYGRTTTGTYYGGSITYGSNTTLTGLGDNVSYTSNVAGSLSNSKSIETGRVEKGESSNQSFETSYGNFNYLPIKEVKYKILPMSSKPIEGKDLKRYCTECSKKLKETFKFCPSCGSKV